MTETNVLLKFLVDVGVGKGIEEFLRKKGHDAKAVRDLDPRMEDSEIIRTAVSEGRIIVTMDKDFGELVYHFSVGHRGVVLLRLEGATGKEKLRIFQYLLENYAGEMENAFCVFQNDKFRIRKIKAGSTENSP